MLANAPVEFARLRRCTEANVDLFHARFVRHRFDAHIHDEWAIGGVLSGAKNTSIRGKRPNIVTTGQIYSLAPGVAHAGHCVDGGACEYVMLYVSDVEWRMQCAVHGVKPDAFAKPSTQPRLLAEFVALADRLNSSPTLVGFESIDWSLFWASLFAEIKCIDVTSRGQISSRIGDLRMARTRDYLHSFLNRNIRLAELAREASLSEPELCRRFSASYGLSPHRYQLVQRLMLCRRLLLDGIPIADVAISTGFADQSHMGRHFRGMFGMTPGTVFRQGCSRTF